MPIIESKRPFNMLSSIDVFHNVYKRKLIAVDRTCLGVSTYQEIEEEFEAFDTLAGSSLIVVQR